jgi:hypothetical protein
MLHSHSSMEVTFQINNRLTNELPNSTDHSPTWKANSSSSSQEILLSLPNLEVHYHFHNSLPLSQGTHPPPKVFIQDTF